MVAIASSGSRTAARDTLGGGRSFPSPRYRCRPTNVLHVCSHSLTQRLPTLYQQDSSADLRIEPVHPPPPVPPSPHHPPPGKSALLAAVRLTTHMLYMSSSGHWGWTLGWRGSQLSPLAVAVSYGTFASSAPETRAYCWGWPA